MFLEGSISRVEGYLSIVKGKLSRVLFFTKKQAVLKKFNNQEVKSNDDVLPVTGENEGTRNNPLSISVEQSGVIHIPFKVLKQN